MAQKTALSVTGTPSGPQSFAAKTAALIEVLKARRVAVQKEDRSVLVLAEDRSVEVVSENRSVTVLGENRSVTVPKTNNVANAA